MALRGRSPALFCTLIGTAEAVPSQKRAFFGAPRGVVFQRRLLFDAREALPLPFAGGGARATRDSSKDYWTSWLNLGSCEEEFRIELCQRLFYQVILAHGDSASEQEQVGLKAVCDQFSEAFRLVGGEGQQHGFAACGLDLRCQRVRIRIANLVGRERHVD